MYFCSISLTGASRSSRTARVRDVLSGGGSWLKTLLMDPTISCCKKTKSECVLWTRNNVWLDLTFVNRNRYLSVSKKFYLKSFIMIRNRRRKWGKWRAIFIMKKIPNMMEQMLSLFLRNWKGKRKHNYSEL